MKILKLLVAAGGLGLAACGGDSLQSPDFTPALAGLTLTSNAEVDDTTATTPADYKLPIGARASLDVVGTFTLPPGSDDEFFDEQTEASLAVTPDGIASIENGELVGITTGVVTVTATKTDDITDETFSSQITFRITPVELVSIAIDPSAPVTISEFQTQSYRAIGTFTDDSTRAVSATWTDQGAVDILTFSPNPGAITEATPIPGSAGSSTTIRATAVDNTDLIAEVTISINTVTLDGIASVTCTPDTIGEGETSMCVANGEFSDGSSGAVPDNLVTWDSANEDAATIDANGDALGVNGGQTTLITATLSSPADSASTTLTVTDARCTTPLLGSAGDFTVPAMSLSSTAGTGAGTPFSMTCLICDVVNPENVIDGELATFGQLSITLGLLNPAVTLATNGSTTYPVGTPVGFVVAQPAGQLLSAELLSTLTITTLDSAGNPLESAGRAQPTFPVPGVPLNATLLGMIGGQEAVLFSFTPTTDAFTGLALTFDGGVVSALPAVNVFQACATADPAATP